MGKKKRGHPDVEEILSRPWCYYCERDFDDLKILINHQKAKHFKCERCGRRLNTAGGLQVHMTQVHKETLTLIENALPNRSNLDVEIFGMEGIPEDVVASHNQRVLSQFAQAEADRRAATGNPGPGGAAGGAAKKPKIEAPSDLKKRLAEHKAKKAAELAAGVSSGDATPIDAVGNQSPNFGQNPGFVGSPAYPQQQQIPYGGPPNSSTYSSFPQPYVQQGQQYPPNQQSFPQQPPGFGAAPIVYPPQQTFQQPQQYQSQGNPNFAPPQFQNGLPNQFPNGPMPPQFQNGPPQPSFSGGPPRAFGRNSPPMPYQQPGQYQPVRTQTPPQRSSSLQAAPGLPQRPSFGAPPVNAFQMQQMHQGQLPGPPATPFAHQQGGISHLDGFESSHPPRHLSPNGTSSMPATNPNHAAAREPADKSSFMPTSSDNLIPSAVIEIVPIPPAGPLPADADAKPSEAQAEKKAKKEKDRGMRMVYSDNDTSPEEKMARLPRYAFTPDGKTGTAQGGAMAAAESGVALAD